MTIRTRLLISAALPFIMGGAILVLSWFYNGERHVLAQNQETIRRIADGVYELSLVGQEYFSEVENIRAREQWKIRYRTLGELLRTTTIIDEESTETLLRLNKTYEGLSFLFDKMAEAQTDDAGLEKKEFKAILTGQMRAKIHEALSHTQKLNIVINAQQDAIFKAMALIVVGVIIALTMLSGVAAFLIGRSIAEPVALLSAGTKRIGEGDLTHRLEVSGRNEISQLSQSFNTMTSRLQQTMASREELAQEVEQRKRAQAELGEALGLLVESNKQLETTQKIGRIGGWRLDVVGNELKWSAEIYRIFGLTPQEFEATYEAFLDMIHPDDREIVKREYGGSMEEGRPYDIEYRIVRKNDGEIRWVHEKSEHYYNAAGDVIRSDGTVQDITERKQAEDLATRFGHIVEQTKNEIFVFDSQTLEFIQVNAGARKNLQYSMEELRNFTPLDIKPEFTPESFEEAIRPLRDGEKEIIVFQTVHKRKDGTVYEVEIHLQLMRDEVPPVFVAIIQDITERLRMEEVLRQSEQMASITSLASGMAHELNNPLGAMLQNVQNISRRLSLELPKNEEVARDLDVDLGKIAAYLEKRRIPDLIESISSAGAQASEIVESLVRLSRKHTEGKEELDLAVLLENSISMAEVDYELTHVYHFKEIEILREFDSALPVVFCQRDEIENVFLAIFRNAAQAMFDQDQPPRITVRTKRYEKGARIEVEDNGPGMKAEIFNRIFEPLFTTTSPQRKGLGLSAAYTTICDNHGGKIRADSEPDKGTKIIIELPFSS